MHNIFPMYQYIQPFSATITTYVHLRKRTWKFMNVDMDEKLGSMLCHVQHSRIINHQFDSNHDYWYYTAYKKWILTSGFFQFIFMYSWKSLPNISWSQYYDTVCLIKLKITMDAVDTNLGSIFNQGHPVDIIDVKVLKLNTKPIKQRTLFYWNLV